jgi:cytochrome P450
LQTSDNKVDWTEVDIHEMAQWIVGRASARMFVGYPACRDDEWVRATIEYGKLIFGLTFLAHKVPKFMHSIVLPLTPGYWRVKKIVKYAYTVCRPAIKNYNEAVAMGTAEAEPFTLLGGMLKHAKNTEGEEQEIVSRQLLLSLASIHTTSMAIVFSLMELCKNPEFIEDLTAEAREMFGEDTDWARHSTTRLPKMDSFIMEIFRLHPPSTILPQRTALEEFTLSNGIRVPVGTHVGFPLGPIALDPSIFPDPNKFDPLRSYRKRVAEGLIGQSSKYMASSATEEHLVFGHGSQACPGRFFAVNEVKLVLLFFLLDFEFKQPERQLSKRLHFPFEEYYVLNPTLKLMMKKKSDSVFK